MELVKTISIGGINGVRKGFKGVETERIVARVAGVVRNAKWADGPLGTYCKFTGEFRAWNEKGEEFSSPVAYLPENAQSKLAELSANDDKSMGVEFAYDFIVVPEKATAMGYTWKVAPLFEPAISNPMAAIMQRIAAPTEETKTEETQPKTEPEKATGGESEKPGKGRKRGQESGE